MLGIMPEYLFLQVKKVSFLQNAGDPYIKPEYREVIASEFAGIDNRALMFRFNRFWWLQLSLGNGIKLIKVSADKIIGHLFEMPGMIFFACDYPHLLAFASRVKNSFENI